MARLSRSQGGLPPSPAPWMRVRSRGTVGHHSVTPMWRGARAARGLYDIARARGFIDVSYNEGSTAGDEELELRGYGRVGGHTRGHNSTMEAHVFVGTFTVTPPPGAMVRAAARSVRRSGVGRFTHGHGDLGSTACPGLGGRVGMREVNARLVSAPTQPAPEPEPEPEEDDMGKLVLARRAPGEGAVYALNPQTGERFIATGDVIRDLDRLGLLADGRRVRHVSRETLRSFVHVDKGLIRA